MAVLTLIILFLSIIPDIESATDQCKYHPDCDSHIHCVHNSYHMCINGVCSCMHGCNGHQHCIDFYHGCEYNEIVSPDHHECHHQCRCPVSRCNTQSDCSKYTCSKGGSIQCQGGYCHCMASTTQGLNTVSNLTMSSKVPLVLSTVMGITETPTKNTITPKVTTTNSTSTDSTTSAGSTTATIITSKITLIPTTDSPATIVSSSTNSRPTHQPTTESTTTQGGSTTGRITANQQSVSTAAQTVTTRVPTTEKTTVASHVPTSEKTTVASHVPTSEKSTVATHVPTSEKTTVATHVATTEKTTITSTKTTTPGVTSTRDPKDPHCDVNTDCTPQNTFVPIPSLHIPCTTDNRRYCVNGACKCLADPPTTTTPAPTTASITHCHTCGDEDAKIPCDLQTIYLGHLTKCPSGLNYCMTDVYQQDSLNSASIYKRCVDEDTCKRLWLDQTSDIDTCVNYAASPGQYVCHFCCTEDGCNSNVVPQNSTFYLA